MTASKAAAALLLSAALGGCFAQDDGDQTLQSATGDLAVTLSGPAGIATKVEITGPKLFKATMTASGSLALLPPGDYTLSPVPVVLQTSLCDTVYTADVGPLPLKVRTGKTTLAEVKFRQRPGSGSLWAPGFGDPRFLSAWAGGDLLRGNAPGPGTLLRNAWEEVRAAQFDPQGNLWLLTQAGGVSQLVVVAWTDVDKPDGAAAVTSTPLGRDLATFTFDGTGGIWAASTATSTVVRYSAAQLASGDTLEPEVVLHANAGSLSQPGLLWFDAGGSLWVGNLAGTQSLVRFSPRQIAASGYPLPLTVLSTPPPSAAALDETGALWLASGTKLYQLSPLQMATSGAPVSKIVVDLGAQTPSSIAFDALGALWFAGITPGGRGTLSMLSPGQLVASGAPAPFVAVAVDLQAGAKPVLAFDPPPAPSTTATGPR